MSALRQAVSRIDSFVEPLLRAAGTPGGAVAVTDRQGLLHVATYGLADPWAQVPVKPDTLFEIGSISKSFTAVALLQQCEEGILDLHEPVERYLPWWHVPSRHEPITLHHLMSHTAGIITGTEFSAEAQYEVWALRETEATAPPGTYFHYSNVGYKALGLILEELLGKSYPQLIEERILAPLGMDATHAAITHETRRWMAVGCAPFYDDRPFHTSHPLAPATWLETATGDGSIAATASDLATYVRMLVNRGQGSAGRVLSEDSFCLMTQPVIACGESDRGEHYAYGLEVGRGQDRTLIGHDGGMVGYLSAILADLREGLGVAVLLNGPGEPSDVAESVLRLASAASRGESLPQPPAVMDPCQVENASAYDGTYRAGTKTFSLAGQGGELVMDYGAERIALEGRGADRFYLPHADLDRFLLRFVRHEGIVAEAFHGGDRYISDRHAGPVDFPHPVEWGAYAGHYRSHNPWYTNFRVVLRAGTLLLIDPQGDERVLVPLGEGAFRVGEDERSPERIRFDTVIGGRAVRANLSCCDFYRTFTP